PLTVPNPATVTVSAVLSSNSLVSASATVTVVAPAAGNIFHVATTGNDANTGTSAAAAWKTIQHAANTVQAGDTVYIHAGTYNESVTIGVSGSATAGPVTFQSAPGEQAIIDGTSLTPSTSDVQGLINIVSRTYVTISGLEIQNFQTSNANAVPAGIWITGSGSNIQILNNSVHNIVTTSEANGNAFGIAVYGSGSTALDQVTLSGNEVFNLKTGESESVNVDGNVTNFVISHNLIHDNDNIAIDAIGFEGVGPSAVDFARNGEISDNTIYNISAKNNAGEGNDYDANGIYVDGGSQIVIERNVIHNVDIGIEMASEHSGHNTTLVTARDNVVYNANAVGISIGGYANNVGGTDSCTIVNNTLFENDTKNTGSGEFQIQFHATNNVFKNNIVYSTSQGLLIDNFTNSTPDPVVSDFNIFFSAGGAASADFMWVGGDHSGLAAFQSASGNDAHSQFIDPQFLSLTTPDLRISATSPAIGSGSDLGTSVLGATDLAGNARVTGSSVDAGAYQQ
ncbi:MAG TPA: right-handed parallel beta-helix repeat-containing protein, partial [Terriglobales bacterium]|nr:right-handed parallel beta-helix repeat-containing protein [Terriglobales bacterium]